MSIESVVGHEPRLAGLWRAARDGRLGHALLLTGPEGIGKFRAARRFAAGLFCATGPGPPCGSCGPCKRYAAGSHPDVFVVDVAADGLESITVGHVAERHDGPPSIEEFLSLRAQEGGWRVVIVREVERMREDAQNAFLKTLEEPARDTLLVLEASAAGRLLATMKSRVVEVALAPLCRPEVLEILEGAGIERGEREVLADLARGAPGRALRLARQGAIRMLELTADVALGEVPPWRATAQLAEVEGEFEGRTPAAAVRAKARLALDLGLELFADLARLEAGMGPAELVHGRLAERVAGRLPNTPWERLVEAWLELRQDVDRNMSPETALERGFDRLAVTSNTSPRPNPQSRPTTGAPR